MKPRQKFIKSCEYGITWLVKEILENPNFDPSFSNNKSLWIAEKNRNFNIIELLLNDKRVRDKLSGREFFHIKRSVLYNTKKQNGINESIKDFLKPKLEDDIESKLENLPIYDRILTIFKYKLYSDDKIKDILNSLSNTELRYILLLDKTKYYMNDFNFYKYLTIDRLKKLFTTVTISHELISNLSFWKELKDYDAMQFINDSSLSKITFTKNRAYFTIKLSNNINEKIIIRILEDLSGEKLIGFFKDKKGKYEQFDNINDLFNILNKNVPEPLRKYFKLEHTIHNTNINRIQNYIKKKRKELQDFEKNETNESIKDFLKPKSEDDIESKLQSLSLPDKIYTIYKYNLYSNDKIKDIFNSLSNDDLKKILNTYQIQSFINNNNFQKFIPFNKIKELFPIVTLSYDLIKNLPFWHLKRLRDYEAMQFATNSNLSKITYSPTSSYFRINLSNYYKQVTIKIQQNLLNNYVTFYQNRKTDDFEFKDVNELFDILSTNENVPEPLRKYFKMEYTLPKTNIKRIEDYIKKKRKELEDFERNEMNESIKDSLKPKSIDEIEYKLENLPNQKKVDTILKYNLLNKIPGINKDYLYNLIDTLDIQDQLYIGSKYNYIDIVKKSLEKGADPSTHKSMALVTASHAGNTNIVKLLLQDKRTEPSGGYNHALEVACLMDRLEVVKLLLDDSRFNTSTLSSMIFNI